MKKIININLSGRVIPIEDAAYERLQRYIESLRTYFAAEEGRDEIINDIESRIAELMNEKVKKGIAAVTEADMNDIISTMGDVEDFQESEIGDSTSTTTASGAAAEPSAFTKVTGVRPRGRLYRAVNDRMLAGVCSGLANYFAIDPTIVRIIFVLLFFAGGSSIFIYLALWVFVPKKVLVPTATKRFFRNPDERIIGGVAGGIGAYFKWDAWTVRLIFMAPFLLNILFGILHAIFSVHGDGDIFPDFIVGSFTSTFFMTYVVLWIILPLAVSPFEKMEMRGEDVDVRRIRENVKSEMENLKSQTQDFAQEVKQSAKDFGARASAQSKAFAADFASSARPVATSAGHVIGVILKAIVLFFATMFALAFFGVITAVVFTGIGDILNNFILENGVQKFFGWAGMLLVFGVPFIALITWLIRRLMKVRNHNRYLGWTFGGLWLIGIVFSVIFIGSMVRSFGFTGKTAQDIAAGTVTNKMVVKVVEPPIENSGYYTFFNNDGDREGFDITNDTMKLSDVSMSVERSADSNYHVVVEKRSQGSSRGLAQERTVAMQYTASVLDSTLNLGSGFAISRNQKWRHQQVIVRIYVPVGKKIRFDETVREQLHPTQMHFDNHGDRRYRRNWESDWSDDNYSNESWKSNVDYVMTANGDLVDPNAPIPPKETPETQQPRNDQGVYQYNERHADSLQRTIEERDRRNEEDRRKLENMQENRRQNGDAPQAPATEPVPEASHFSTPGPILAAISLVG
jgi:phage shock protein PspC (stress-responsive transcriptional regulator)